MSFSLFEADPNRGVPIELFTFEYGASAPLRYTNAEVDLKIDGVDYRAIPISRGNIKVDGKTDRKSLTIQVDKSAEVAFLFLGYPPTETVVYTIRAVITETRITSSSSFPQGGCSPTNWRAPSSPCRVSTPSRR